MRNRRHPEAGETAANRALASALRGLELLGTARDGAFDRLTRLAVAALDVDVSAIALVAGGEGRLVRFPHHGPPVTGLAASLCQRVVDDASPVVIDDILAESARQGPLVSPADIRAFAGVPLAAPSGRILGVLSATDHRPRRWSPRDLGVLWSLADWVLSEAELDVVRRRDRTRGEELETLVGERTASLERANRFLMAARADLSRSREETIWRLTGAIAARSGETGAHSRRMGLICAALADRTGVDPRRTELIRIASPLHDVGKLAIPDTILNKPGPLSPAERTVIETHAEIGHRMLAGSGEPLLELAAVIAHTHHERVDGQGYPDGLGGADIPIEGRIAAVADVFDALTNDRVYRPAFGVADAMTLMDAGRGTQFDAGVYDALRDGLPGILATVGSGSAGGVPAEGGPPDARDETGP